MSEANRFGEPWSTPGTDHDGSIDDCEGNWIGGMHDPCADRCKRIVECVNALSRVGHPSALPELLEAAFRVVEQNRINGEWCEGVDELVEAFKALGYAPGKEGT